MSKGFTKLFSSIITSSIWSEDDYTRLLWITMLASADAEGNVSGTIPGMAAIARMSLENTEKSLEKLCAPDPYSRSKSNEGRRIIENEDGWHIVNYKKYRQKRNPETRKQQNREAQKRYRDAKNKDSKPKVSQSKPRISRGKPESAQAEAEGEVYKRIKDSSSKFDVFWKAYPKKKGKGAARKVFEKLSPDARLFDKILATVEQQKLSTDWIRDCGQYIPHPAT